MNHVLDRIRFNLCVKPGVRLPGRNFSVCACLLRGGCLVCLLFLTRPAWAQDLDTLRGDAHFPWHITADALSFDEARQVYVASGNVVISKIDQKIIADRVYFDHKQMRARASGHVIMTVGKDIITADRLDIDLNTEQGSLQNGYFFLHRENFHIRGNRILKTGPDTYQADKATLTTCNGENPAWKITGRNLNITIEGYGYARHAVLWAKRVPVFYTPFIAFPVKSKRQTGLLPPQMGYSSRKGNQFNQPLFWAINDSTDATFYDHYMQERGNKLGAEFRYIAGPETRGTLMIDYFEDDKIDDGTGDNTEDWGYDDSLDDENGIAADILRPNRERYWFRMKHDQNLPWGLSGKLDLDVVSDQDYLKEFKSGYNGYQTSDNYFNNEFSRDLEDYNDYTRLNRLNVSRNWSRFNLDAEFRWYDNVVNRQQKDRDTTVQRLPAIRLEAPKRRLGTSPFYTTMRNEYTYFYRQNTDTPNSALEDHRLDVYPRVFLPLRWQSYFTLEPSLGYRATGWQVVNQEDPPEDAETDDNHFRQVPDYRVDLTSEFYRIFNTRSEPVDRIKHTVKPQIVYTYIPEVDQSELPEFDSLDRIEKENKLTYSLTNLLTYRSKTTTSRPDAPADAAPDYQYQQVLRLYLEQSYHFPEGDDDESIDWINTRRSESFSPVYGRLELTPRKYFSLLADGEWSPYETDLDAYSVASVLTDTHGFHLTVEHRYQKEIPAIGQEGLQSAYAKIQIPVGDALTLFSEYENDLYADKELLTRIGGVYTAQCWSFRLTFTREDDEETYEFMIGLTGLGEFESGL